jgi:hypothetical protein
MNPPNDDFFMNTMPDHVRKQYFLLFLISANQRFSLLSLQQEIADNWLAKKNDDRDLTFEHIYEHLLEFEARVYFAQVMQKNHHHRCYLKCQEVFQITKLHEELSEEIQRMYERINLERSEKIQRRIDFLTFMIGLPALILSFIATPWESMKISWALRIIIFILLISFGWLIVLCLRTSKVMNVLKMRMKK